MAQIAERIDQERLERSLSTENPKNSISNAISYAVGEIANQLKAKAIVTLTKTGATARNVSKFRPNIQILAVTPDVDVARRMQLVWGVHPLLVLNSSSTDQTIQASLNSALEQGFVAASDLVVITAGTLQGISGSTDLIKVEIVSSVMGQGTSIGQGLITGAARVAHQSGDVQHFNRGEILVVSQTDVGYVDAMRKAAGIITESHDPNGHAVVLGARLKIPVIFGISNATQLIRNGTVLTMDMARGLVYSGVRA
jgi:pyruvate kinase